LHQTILALFADRGDRERTTLLLRLAMMELDQAEDSATFMPLPREPRCQRARIAAAIERLSTDAGVSVKQLASDLGYASVPAFSHAFRQVTGKTPTEFAGKE